MAIRAARPGPGTGPPWPVLYRAVPSPAQYHTGPCRASPRAPLTAQARARGPVSCRAGPRKPGTTTQIGPPEAQKLKKKRCRWLRWAGLLAAARVSRNPALPLQRAPAVVLPASQICRAHRRHPPRLPPASPAGTSSGRRPAGTSCRERRPVGRSGPSEGWRRGAR